MRVELLQTGPATPEEPNEDYEEDLHDVNAIIMDMCNALGDTKAFQFRVSGFGQEEWPVDVGTDLATVLEQLPDTLLACSRKRPFLVEFFEQGVDRSLLFEPVGESSYRISCSAGGGWEPHPRDEELTQREVLGMFSRLGATFCRVARSAFPRTSQHPWFLEFEATLKSNSAS